MHYDMWKSVENLRDPVGATPDSRGRALPAGFGEPFAAALAWRACSACAGDYEDPDRTAWRPDPDDELAIYDAEEDRRENDDEFPDL